MNHGKGFELESYNYILSKDTPCGSFLEKRQKHHFIKTV